MADLTQTTPQALPVTPPLAPAPQEVATPSPLPESPKLNRKIIILGILGLMVLIISALYVIVLLNKKPVVSPTPPPPPTPAETPVLPPRPGSKYASDAGILDLKARLGSLSGRIDSVDLYEPELALPNIDLGIAIK